MKFSFRIIRLNWWKLLYSQRDAYIIFPLLTKCILYKILYTLCIRTFLANKY